MPLPGKFLAGFNVHQNMHIGGYVLVDIKIEHETVIRYHEYRYPMTLTWEGKGDAGTLLNKFEEHVAGKRIIDSEYGNPYECDFGNIRVHDGGNGTVVMTTVGHSRRVYQRALEA